MKVILASPYCQLMSDLTRAEKRYPSGTLREETWCRHGQKHRDSDLPALIIYREDGSISWQEWYQNGQLHPTGY